RPALCRVARLYSRVLDLGAPQVLLAERLQPGIDLDRVDMVRPRGEKGGEVAAAGTDLEHALVLSHGQLLKDSRLDLRLPHALALLCTFVQRNFQVREGEIAVQSGDEFFTRHRVEQVEHVLVEHLPWTDLLLDHVEAGLLDGHARADGAEGRDSSIVSPLSRPVRRT